MNHDAILLVDLGGTHIRFAALKNNVMSPLSVFYCTEYADVIAVVSTYLKTQTLRFTHAIFAIAAPILGDEVRMTNLPWVLNRTHIKKTLGFEAVTFINDFYALAHALPLLAAKDVFQIGGGILQPTMPKVVLGPGTGLGVSAVFFRENAWHVTPSEGGHIDFAPQTLQEWQFLEYLMARYNHVSIERILSGAGLVDLYTFYYGTHLTAAEITESALQGHLRATEVLNHFCRLLGAAAGNFALIFNAQGGVYLGGGIMPRIVSFLKNSPFRKCFEAKGRFQTMLSQIPTFVIMDNAATLKGVSVEVIKRIEAAVKMTTASRDNCNIVIAT